MGSTTKAATQREQAKKRADAASDEPQDVTAEAPEAESPGPRPDEPGGVLWAKAGDIQTEEAWEDTVLPNLGQWVRVRFLPTPELARLQFLPDLLPFAELTAQVSQMARRTPEEREEAGDEDAMEIDPAAYAAENYRYQSWVAHAAIMDTSQDPRPRKCDHCTRQATDAAKTDSIQVVRHPASLWTPAQCMYLKTGDLGHVAGIALRVGEVKRLIPFSGLSTESGSPPPATTGE